MSEVKEKLDELEKVLDEWVDFSVTPPLIYTDDGRQLDWYTEVCKKLIQLRIAIARAGL